MTMAKDDSNPGTYGVSKEKPAKRRFIPQPGFQASTPRVKDKFDEPLWKRFIGDDLFPWALALCTVLWISLGLAARRDPMFATALVGVGLIACVLGQVWLYLAIFQENATSGVLSLLSSWYRFFYLHLHPEIGWRPKLISAMGLLMAATGVGILMSRG